MLSSIENRNYSGSRVASLNHTKASDHCYPGTISYSQYKHFYEAKKKNIYTCSYSTCSSSQEENKQTYSFCYRNKANGLRAQSLVDIRNYLEDLSYLLEQEEISHRNGRKLDLSKVTTLSEEVKSPPKRRRRRRKPKQPEQVVDQPISFRVQELFSEDSEEIEVILC